MTEKELHLIDKSALVAEIKKRLKANGAFDEMGDAAWCEDKGMCDAYKSILSFINTLEVKEIDNVWHSVDETPKGAGDKEILVQFTDSRASVIEIDDWEYLDHQTKWAYLKDLT